MSDTHDISEPEGEFDHIQNQKKKRFLVAYSVLGLVTHAAKAAGCTRQAHSLWMHNDPEYKEAFAVAKSIACDFILSEVRRRAVEGVRRPMMFKDKQVEVLNPETGKMEPVWEYTYSDSLAMRLLEALDPETFKQRSESTVKAEVSVVQPNAPSDAFLRRCNRIPANPEAGSN